VTAIARFAFNGKDLTKFPSLTTVEGKKSRKQERMKEVARPPGEK
jgi:hypothetical protein